MPVPCRSFRTAICRWRVWPAGAFLPPGREIREWMFSFSAKIQIKIHKTLPEVLNFL